MMMQMLKVILAIVAILIFTLVQNIINAKKHHRARQFLLPFCSVIIEIVGVILVLKYFEFTEKIIGDNNFFQNSNILIANAVILVGFIILKCILCPIITSIWKKKSRVEATSISFYEFDEEYDEWFLKHKWVNFRKFFLAIVCGTAIASGILLGLGWAYGSESVFWFMAFPCAMLSVINEIFNFINGQTKEEFEHSVLGDDADSRKVSNFYKVREILERILPEPLISAHTGFEYIGKQTPADFIKKLKSSDDSADNIVAEYFEMNDRYKTSDLDFVQATAQMMHRKSVVFCNPFYKDLTTYITLPLVTALLSGKKCVVITGRMSLCDDVKKWLSDTIKSYTHIESLWRVEELCEKEPECEVGILSFPQLYDNRIITTNRDFFNETDFVLLIEPSVIVNTAQVALSILAQEMHFNDEKPVYCICDRNVDGLVDTLSHVLHTELTDVVAPPIPRCMYSGMTWDANGDFIRQSLFDKQTKYLGNGVELAAIAVKNQIPKVTWYCESKAPIKDIKWIAGQYHHTICKYMNLPAHQKKMYEKIDFVPNLWSSKVEDEQFIIAEDEFCNMFSTLRAFLSRAKNQAFVNVLSENYLLRDYMRCNSQMFLSNPDAIPSIVPDYSKTERNTLLKLILMMNYRPVTDAEIINEFHLVGIETTDAFELLTGLLKKYTYADNSIFTVKSVRTSKDDLSVVSSYQYSISNEQFDEFFANSLKNAYFILEDEKLERGYIDAKLFSHVTQLILPGQFVTYEGKYYVVKHISPQSGVVLRRASDLYDGRKYYRQVRDYTFANSDDGIISIRKIMDIEVAFIQKDFSVNTTGYLELNDNHDLRLARLIDFADDPSIENYSRKYHNKTVLRIKLPDSNEKIRFTVCLLLSEIFKSVFPDGWPYLAVVSKRPEDIDGILNYVVYPVEGEFDEDYIYIIEDSDLDLGLLEAVERNLMKIMEIVADFLEWHLEKMREPASKDPVPSPISVDLQEEKKRNLFQKMADRIRRLFGGKKESVEIPSTEKTEKVEQQVDDIKDSTETETTEITEDKDFSFEDETKEETEPFIETSLDESDEEKLDSESQENDESITTDANEDPLDIEKPQFEEDDFLPKDDEDPDIVHIDGTDIFDNEGMPEDNDMLEFEFKRIGLIPLTKSRYQQQCYLKYGFEEVDGRLQVEELMKYLRVRGWCNNSLTKARKRDVLVKSDLDLHAENHCDFCSLPLSGVSYERLNDGRIRCNDCSSSAIESVEEFRTLFYQVLELMEDFYGVKYKVPISVKTADARVIAKGAGCIFRPSNQVANRVLGYAQKKRGKYSLIIENGSPRLASIDTMVHEMTHIWQYLNWNDSQLTQIYGMACPQCTEKAKLMVYEGMAMWASIQYLYQIGETYYATQQEALAEARGDVYGLGFRLYRDRYPLLKDTSLIKYSPFADFPPLDPVDVKAMVKATCTAEECLC